MGAAEKKAPAAAAAAAAAGSADKLAPTAAIVEKVTDAVSYAKKSTAVTKEVAAGVIRLTLPILLTTLRKIHTTVKFCRSSTLRLPPLSSSLLIRNFPRRTRGLGRCCRNRLVSCKRPIGLGNGRVTGSAGGRSALARRTRWRSSNAKSRSLKSS